VFETGVGVKHQRIQISRGDGEIWNLIVINYSRLRLASLRNSVKIFRDTANLIGAWKPRAEQSMPSA